MSLDVTRNYFNSLFVFEDFDNENFRNKRPDVLKMILRSYARNISSEVSKQTIIEDVRQSNERTMDTVRHYRDKAGLECDAVIHLEDGRWGAVEIKLGGEKLIEEGAKSLKLLKEKIATKSSERHPSFLMVLTAHGSLYQREDGIYVVPINCLRD